MRPAQPFQKEAITVAEIIDHLRTLAGIDIVLANAASAERRPLTESHVHRPGLALAGYTELFTSERIQVLGNTEVRYLTWLGEAGGAEAFERLVAFNVPCVVLTAGNTLPEPLLALADAHGVPVYRTPVPTVPFMLTLRDLLEDQFALQLTLHGSLVDVYGIGLLITGPAGIGKSEIALDLVERGHRLVADDVVIATRKGSDVLMGTGTDLAKHFMEVRGLGILDVKAMFGVRAIRYQKRIEVVVRVHPWDPKEEYTRLGMVDENQTILDVPLPLVKLPVTPGKNVTVLCEVIAMNHLLRHYGYDPADEFARRLNEQIARKRAAGGGRTQERGVEWFETDIE
ncbi:MAG TPA: HPr(Ser) kinase/phosphatase [Rubricoccaceae bacterium]